MKDVKNLPTASSDLLIIGEIRDSETARAVVQSQFNRTEYSRLFMQKSVRGVYERLVELGVSEDMKTRSCFTRCLLPETNWGRRIIDLQTKIIRNRQTNGMNKLTNFLRRTYHYHSKLKRRKLATSKRRKSSLSLTIYFRVVFSR